MALKGVSKGNPPRAVPSQSPFKTSPNRKKLKFTRFLLKIMVNFLPLVDRYTLFCLTLESFNHILEVISSYEGSERDYVSSLKTTA